MEEKEINPEAKQEGEQADKDGNDELLKCQKERDEYLDGWRRAKAELMNYKKEEAKRFETVVKLANEGLIKELLLVLDSFDLAIIALEQSQINADDTQINAEKSPRESALGQRESASWQKGMYLIRSQLKDILKSYGLEEIAILVGKIFDPAFQEAVAEIESNQPTGTIIEEVEKGYLLNGQVVRPVRVKIAK